MELHIIYRILHSKGIDKQRYINTDIGIKYI